MLKTKKPDKYCRKSNEEPIDPVKGQSRTPVTGGRQCRFSLYQPNLEDQISDHVTAALRRALLLEIRRILATMRTTQREANMFAKRQRHVLNAWRCEEARGGSWSARVCRDLLGIGRSQSCKPQQCSKMKERLDRHQINCHAVSKAVSVQPRRARNINKMDRSSSTSTKSSVGISTSRVNSPLTRKPEFHSAQTNVSLTDNRKLEPDNETNRVDKEQNRLKDGIPIKSSDTRAILPKRNVYSERLNNEVQEFFYDIPVFPNTSEMVKQKRLDIIKNFVDKIADLFLCINNEDYYDKVRDEIEQCLRNLPMWEPESERDKNGFKNCLGDSLLQFIKTFNEQWYSFRKDSQTTGEFPNSFVAYNDHMNHILENVIINWVKCNLKTSSKNDIVIDTLIKKLKPMLASGTDTKHALKAEILNILEELSPHLHLPKNKTILLNKLAIELANVLSTIDDKESLCYKYHCKTRYRVEDEENSIEILNDPKLTDDLEDDTVNHITDILFGNIDLVLHENSLDVVKDVCRVLKSTGEFSDTEANSLAKTLVTNVKDCFNEDFYTKMGNPHHSSSFLILTSEQELSENSGPKFHSTPLTYTPKKEIPALNKAEKVYIEKVSAIVRTWLDTTDVNFETIKGQILKESVVTDTTNGVHDIVKQTLQLQIPGKKIDGKDLNFVIMRAIKKFALFSTPVTEDSPQVVDLWEHLMALDTRDLLNTSPFLESQKSKQESPVKNIEPQRHSYKNNESDVKLDEFVKKFIQRSYNIDDVVVKGVLTLMLRQEVYKLSPTIREDLYQKNTSEDFNTDKFEMELQVVKEVYDWLKKIPFYYPLLKSGKETIDFVHGLARNITDIETERVNYPKRMDYDSWLHTEIAVYLLQKEEEIDVQNMPKIDYHANELYLRIINLRKDCSEGELNKIIAEYMKKYESLLAKDYLKKILWHRRLGENVVKMLLGNPAASRADVENTLATVPVPRDESVFKFKMQIKYNITIQDWLHALPLIPPKDNEEELTRKNMIQELLHKITETDEIKSETESLDDYIRIWISRMNLDPTVDIDVPMLISQLRSGLEFVKWTEKQPQQPSDLNLQGTMHRTRHSRAHAPKPRDPGELIVEAIESWCNNLPIEEDTVEATKATKEQVATNIFQIVGSLSGDPRIANDNQKFRDMMANEIDAQLQNLSQYYAVKENMDNLKAELLDKIIEVKIMIRDVTAGDDYVQALEKSIDKTLSKPPHGSSIKTNPGYELFKKRMVMLWLLQNYDCAVDFHSLKYKKMLSDEINLLSEEAQKEKVFPADKEEMMNDLMSVFYLAQLPNEDAIIYEIEYIKLRCEIESWVKELPLRETFGYNRLLERDQILTILSKVLFDIERSEEADADEKMQTEIIKWSKKLPLLPGEKNNLTGYADLLICLLKASANSRKCQRQAEPKNLSVVQETLKNLKSSDELNRIRETLSVPKTDQGNTSQVAAPSALRPCSHECGATKEKLTYLITKAINNWCYQLPLEFHTPDEQNVIQKTKEYIVQRLMHLVSELHYRPNTLNNEGLYEYYLNNEIENILLQLVSDRLYWEGQFDRNERKYQLINALKAIRPLVQDEKEREGYKENLKHTISSFHESMAPYSAVQISKDAQMAILDDFIQFKNHQGDFESQELYKLKINETLNNELNEQEVDVDPLLAANRLICEMSKVKSQTQAHRDTAQVAATQRRFSQPNPVSGISRSPAVPVLRRHSLSYPLSQKSCPRFVPSHNFLHPQSVMTFPDPVLQPQPYFALKSMPVPTARVIYQIPPDFQQGSMPFPAPRTISQRPPGMQQGSAPFLVPRVISQRLPDWQQEPMSLPFPVPRTQVPQTNLEARPFPTLNPTHNTNYQSPRTRPQGPQILYREAGVQPPFIQRQNVQPDFDINAHSHRELQEPQNVEQQNVYQNVQPGETETRTTARVQNSPRSLTECPQERRETNREGEQRWTDRDIKRSRQASRADYCETCDRDRDCAYKIPRPYPMPLDYMNY